VGVRQIQRGGDQPQRIVGQVPELLLREVERRHHDRLLGLGDPVPIAQRRDLVASIRGEFE